MRTTGASRSPAVVLLAVALLAGCGQGSGAAPRATTTPATSTALPTFEYDAPVDGMVALAYRTRLDDAAGGVFQVKLQNTGTTPFTVVATALDSAGFEALPPAARDTEFSPGARIDMPTPYGAALCGPDQPAEPAYAALDVVRPDGMQERVRVPMPSDYDVLTRIHDEECSELAIAAAVTVELVDLTPVGAGSEQVLAGELRLTRQPGTGELAITELRGNVLYDILLTDGTQLPVSNGPEAPGLGLPITIGPATCMTHVLAEIKQPYVYPVWIAVDDDEPVRLEIPVPQAQRDQIAAMLAVACDL